MAKSHKTCMEQAEIIDTFGMYHTFGDNNKGKVIGSGLTAVGSDLSLPIYS